MSGIEDKRAALELAVLFRSDAHPESRDATLHAFTKTLSGYIEQLLQPELEDGAALHIRAKAIGLIEMLTEMGVDIAHVMEKTPVKRSIANRVTQSLGLEH